MDRKMRKHMVRESLFSVREAVAQRKSQDAQHIKYRFHKNRKPKIIFIALIYIFKILISVGVNLCINNIYTVLNGKWV